MAIHFPKLEVVRPGFLGGDQWQLTGLNHITVLFGRNGAGKSLLLRAIRDVDNSQRHYVVPERLGGIEGNAPNTGQLKSGKERARRSTGNSATEYRTDVFSKVDLYYSRRGGIREDVVPGNPDELEKLLSEFFPDFRIDLPRRDKPLEITRTETDELVPNVAHLSSGEAEYLSVALDLVLQAGLWTLEARKSPILLVDEPDQHLHPDLQQRFGQFLVQVVDHFDIQVIVATHSTTLLSAIG